MGISPAPPWATIFYALHENNFLPPWSHHILFYKRFIDDVFGIWAQDTINWCSFKQTMQQWHGLQWDFTPLHLMQLYGSHHNNYPFWSPLHPLYSKRHKTSTYTSHPTLPTLLACSPASSTAIFYASTDSAHPQKTSNENPLSSSPASPTGIHHQTTHTTIYISPPTGTTLQPNSSS
eukprot:CCRYP_000115-RA/>CCRYP_000115-RA protein AED:0.52 eAED:0.77 QI:0/0/0/1/0/0/2/0/176